MSWAAFPYLLQGALVLPIAGFYLAHLKDAVADTTHAAAAVAFVSSLTGLGVPMMLWALIRGRRDQRGLRRLETETGLGPEWRHAPTLRPPYLIQRIGVASRARVRNVLALTPLMMTLPAWLAARIHGPTVAGVGVATTGLLLVGVGILGLDRQEDSSAWEEVDRAASAVPLTYVPASAVSQRGGAVILARCGVPLGSPVADVAVRLASQTSPPVGGVLEFLELARAVATDTRPC